MFMRGGDRRSWGLLANSFLLGPARWQLKVSGSCRTWIMFILEFASSIKSADEPFFNYRWHGTVAASDAGTQAAGGRHGGRNELTNSRFIDEEYKAGIEGRSVKDLNNIIEQNQQAIKRVIRPLLGGKLFRAAQRAVAGIKVMEMTEKGGSWRQAMGTSRDQQNSSPR
jgi:hypothetical protein